MLNPQNRWDEIKEKIDTGRLIDMVVCRVMASFPEVLGKILFGHSSLSRGGSLVVASDPHDEHFLTQALWDMGIEAAPMHHKNGGVCNDIVGSFMFGRIPIMVAHKRAVFGFPLARGYRNLHVMCAMDGDDEALAILKLAEHMATPWHDGVDMPVRERCSLFLYAADRED